MNGLTKRYGDTTVVDHINFSVHEGEFISLLGPIRPWEDHDVGHAGRPDQPGWAAPSECDRDLTHLNPEDRNVGVVFQNYALFPHMTAEQNVMFPLVMRGVPRAALGSASDALGLCASPSPVPWFNG